MPNNADAKIDRQKRADLIDQILASKHFSEEADSNSKRLLKELLRSHNAGEKGISSPEIVDRVLNPDSLKPVKMGAARQACTVLRHILKGYNNSLPSDYRGLRVSFPDAAGRPRVYRLDFWEPGRYTPTQAFWQAHIDDWDLDADCFIVCNEPVFFRREKTGEIFRYPDVNTWIPDRLGALGQLFVQHHAVPQDGVDAYYQYLYTGEILAADRIQAWFLSGPSIALPRSLSRDVRDIEIKNASMILLGNSRVNRYICEILNTREGKELGYKKSREQFGVVEVHRPSHDEEEALKELGESIRYEADDSICRLTDNPQGDVFVLVSRLPNPYGQGTITILDCDYTRALEQVAIAITQNHLLEEAMSKAKWPPGAKVAQTFQALYAVQMGSSSLDSGGRDAKFVMARQPHKSGRTHPSDVEKVEAKAANF